MSLYVPDGLALLNEARDSAKRDLSTLGYEATPAMVESYLDQFSHWPWPEPWPHVLQGEVEKAEADAPTELLEALPRESPAGARRAKQASSDLEPDTYQRWRSEVLFVVRARMLHERALVARDEHFRLSGAESLPSALVFRERLDDGIRSLTRRNARCGRGPLDRLIGASAADASHWRLDCLRWQLELADMELLPLGSYLSRKSEPKQLRILHVIECRIRVLLGSSLPKFAVSRMVAASLMVYMGQRLVPAKDVGDFARNAVTKWRKRMRPDLAAETIERFSIEGGVLRAMSLEPEQPVMRKITIGAPSRKPRS